MHLTRQKPGKKKPYRFFRSDRAKTWQRPTFPGDPSIIGAGELNYRVRNGNGCDLSAIITRRKFFESKNFLRAIRVLYSQAKAYATNSTLTKLDPVQPGSVREIHLPYPVTKMLALPTFGRNNSANGRSRSTKK